ncbi:MAG: DUF4007 family protein [Tildeniella nuda ZEHNDER 1965/U140]|jgi:hypothetical protein|nr:DUF4007 family protein [Tildeniella nuda ZEHNDER 1965/U140]
MPALKLSFHGTFALKKQDVLKLLEVAETEQGLHGSLMELVERTGLGNEKVLRIKSWAVRSGLVHQNHLSPEGVVVRTCDPYLTSPVTDWLMHSHLSFSDRGLQSPPANPAEWGGWSYFVFCFLPEHPEFTLDELVKASAPVFEDVSSRLLRTNFRFVLRAYTEVQALWSCRFVQSLGNNRFRSGEAQLPNAELLGYFLAKLWQRDFGAQETVALTQLHQPMGLAPILGISDLSSCLQRLETQGLLRQSDNQGDSQITRCWQDPLFLLKKAYGSG